MTAPLVYVNYGNRDDYEQLDRLGVSVKGAIVIARYGEAWRGIKPKVAAEHGAIGCIIYSDPKEDGYFHGDDYPEGGWRPSEGVQRGSVMDTDYPGDPLTPGVGADPGAKRLAIKDAQDHHQNPCAAHFVRRRSALSLRLAGPGRTGKLARRTAHHLPRRSRPGAGSSQSHVELGYQTRERRDRDLARLDHSR